jgi:hypothetical protein
MRGHLGNPKYVVHHELPITVIASTTLTDVTTGARSGVTASGGLLPMHEVIRMASYAYHSLTADDFR